jgi:DNA-binding transcriptional MocR family regulator
MVASTASVRSVALDLGVAKNTAHRALSKLAGAGLITAEQERLAGGAFGRGHYRLHLGDALVLSAGRPNDPDSGRPVADGTKPTAQPPARRTRRNRATAQLSLLDA